MAGSSRRGQRSRNAAALSENTGESTMLTRMIGTPPKGGPFCGAASKVIM
jgi:hypothetical protein